MISHASIYYAHPISLYNTRVERQDTALLEELGFCVVNPNHPTHAEGYVNKGMEYFKDIVGNCDALAFRAFPDGSIPAGVAKEIKWAREVTDIIFELPTGVIRRSLSVEVTREMLKELGLSR
jgi:hypothetical protein